MVTAGGEHGFPDQTPCDAIAVTAAARDLPAAQPVNALPAEIPMFTRDLMKEDGQAGRPPGPRPAPARPARHDRLITQAIGLTR